VTVYQRERRIMTKLTTLKNIGKEIEKKLNFVGINSAEELKDIGSKEAWVRLKLEYPEVCLVHLYTLEGAIRHIEYNQLSKETKKDLKQFTDQWKN
jgi:TfoX C-terminal domain.